ncbi:hypothetical protein LUZ60_012989 [Juncus effusus]|nr:hypothetical protein LUZ60_012989 [Juncus effusus]
MAVLTDNSPSSFIRMVQNMIERCLLFGMNMEECMEALSNHANIKPVITSTVWKELEKENKEFFASYGQWRDQGKAGSQFPISSIF